MKKRLNKNIVWILALLVLTASLNVEATPTENKENKKPTSTTKKIGIAAAAVVGIAAIGAACWKLFGSMSGETSSSDHGQYVSGGFSENKPNTQNFSMPPGAVVKPTQNRTIESSEETENIAKNILMSDEMVKTMMQIVKKGHEEGLSKEELKKMAAERLNFGSWCAAL